MTDRSFSMGGRRVGAGAPPLIIAEMSCNHMGSFERAMAILEAAAAAGAGAVKLQTLRPEGITLDSDRPGFRISGGLWDGRRLFDLYREAQTPWDWHEALFRRGRELGVPVFSSPFDLGAVDFLESLDAPAYKVASFEAIDIPLIERVSATGKPVIISTGMANLDEIAEAVRTARSAGCRDLALLHCVSGYPTPPEEANLLTLRDMAERFDVVAGLSDHTPGTAVAVAAVTLGAALIEKHVTLSRQDPSLDAAFSLEPAELQQLCEAAATAAKALGHVDYAIKPSEQDSLRWRRSLFIVEDMTPGAVFTARNLRSLRPALGLAPKHLKQVLGRKAAVAIGRGTPLSWDLVS
jgi:N-acetylneuraminate synthase